MMFSGNLKGFLGNDNEDKIKFFEHYLQIFLFRVKNLLFLDPKSDCIFFYKCK